MKRNTAMIILYDKDHNILLQHRTDDAPVFPGYWGVFGGKIQEGESAKDAVIRETKEELNYELQNPKQVLEIDYENKNQNNSGVKYYFIEKCLDKSNLVLNEGKEMKWFSFEEIQTLKIIDHNLEAIQKIVPQLKNV